MCANVTYKKRATKASPKIAGAAIMACMNFNTLLNLVMRLETHCQLRVAVAGLQEGGDAWFSNVLQGSDQNSLSTISSP